MFRTSNSLVGVLAAIVLLLAAAPAVTAQQPPDQAAVDKAFEVLATYDWGNDRSALGALDKAVAASHKDAAARKALETRLAALLKSDSPQAAKDIVCRQLSIVGTAASVPAVAALLTDEKLSHIGRYALERMPCPEAVKALRDALPKTKGLLKVGVINSLGVRRDAESTTALVALLGDSDQQVAAASAAALGAIGSSDAAKALAAFQAKAPDALRLTVADARLTCAERMLADGKKVEAMVIYKALSTPDQPRHVRLAATRGLLAAAARKK